jgi:hypothetical protein
MGDAAIAIFFLGLISVVVLGIVVIKSESETAAAAAERRRKKAEAAAAAASLPAPMVVPPGPTAATATTTPAGRPVYESTSLAGYFTYDLIPPPGATTKVFSAYPKIELAAMPVYRHQKLSLEAGATGVELLTMRTEEPGWTRASAPAFYAYPMDFPHTQPIFLYRHLSRPDCYRLSASSKLAEAMPNEWVHHLAVERPVFFAPI